MEQKNIFSFRFSILVMFQQFRRRFYQMFFKFFGEFAHQGDGNFSKDLPNFIDKCDFYNYKAPKANDENSRCVTEVQTMSDGSHVVSNEM